MKTKILFKNIILVLSTVTFCFCSRQTNHNEKFVDPFIGTAGNGHTYPGATTPFGMVQVSPETGNIGWDYCSGYHYEDSTIMGFSHTHLSGTGWLDMGDILLQPFTGEVGKEHFKSRFSHNRESASPGYYSVELLDFGIKVELTATQRAAYHRYTYPNNKEECLFIDLQHGIVPTPEDLKTHVVKSELTIDNPREISGYTVTNGWAGEKHVYFFIRFSKPFISTHWLSGNNAGRNQKIALEFKTGKSNILEVQVGLSSVSSDGAKKNLESEIKNSCFECVKEKASEVWRKYLNQIEIDAPKQEKKIFYTALYHNLVTPNNIADIDGKYRGPDGGVYTADSAVYYSTLSFWDTYRATNPLLNILCPDIINGIVKSMLAHYDIAGVLPIWTLWGHENHCMIGNHAIPVIADAYINGIRGYDTGKAYEAIKTSSLINHPKSDWDKYNRYGYLPSDSVPEEAVSRTLEFSFDDWCVSRMAKAMGKTEDYQYFLRRSGFYKNLFDKSTGLMRGRNSDKTWVSPFDPLKLSHAGTGGGDYTEGNAWQYTWHVQHDIPGLIELMGGEAPFVSKLDSLFQMDPLVYGDGLTVDISGLVGQYVHGNEPCHHIPYLYNFAGQPWKAQEKVHEIIKAMYNSSPGGLCGNDDCGQMSAWYIFSSLGFYPVCPGSGNYVIESPLFKKAAILLPNGKEFNVIVTGLDGENIYIQSAKLNGASLNKTYITQNDIKGGGTLHFLMGSKPQKNWGKGTNDLPVKNETSSEVSLRSPARQSSMGILKGACDIE